MKQAITPTYTFTPSAGTLDFTAFAGFNISLLYAVINLTRAQIIYAAGAAGLGYSTLTGTNSTVLNLQANVSTHSSTDKLLIIYEGADPDAPYSSSEQMTVGTVYPAGRGVGINCSIAGNVTINLSGGSAFSFPVDPGWNQLDKFACTGIASAGTTAIATYWNFS